MPQSYRRSASATSRSSSATWAGLIFSRASASPNHCARSTSGNSCELARPGRPLERKRVAVHDRHVDVAGERPCLHDLAGLLLDLAEAHGLALRWRQAELLLELPACGGKRVFLRPVLALRDRPGASVAASPQRAAGMHEQDLEGVSPAAVKQDPGAAPSHVFILARARRADRCSEPGSEGAAAAERRARQRTAAARIGPRPAVPASIPRTPTASSAGTRARLRSLIQCRRAGSAGRRA